MGISISSSGDLVITGQQIGTGGEPFEIGGMPPEAADAVAAAADTARSVGTTGHPDWQLRRRHPHQ